MNISENGVDFIKRHEAPGGNPVLYSYPDQGGVLTIGFGHTGADVVPGMTIMPSWAGQLLINDLQSTISGVNSCVKVPLNQNQFDALCDFAFNEGVGALERSTLLRMLNAGTLIGAAIAGQFDRWDMDAGKPDPGLLNRRNDEVTLFNTVPT